MAALAAEEAEEAEKRTRGRGGFEEEKQSDPVRLEPDAQDLVDAAAPLPPPLPPPSQTDPETREKEVQEGIQRLGDALDIRYTQLYEGRGDTLEVHWKAWFESGAFKGSMKWLTWSGFYRSRYSLQPQEYIDLLSLRLLESPFRQSLTGQIPKCRCEFEVDLSTLPLHALQCDGACYLDNPRHNDIRDIVYAFAQTCHPETQPKKEHAIIHPVTAKRYEGDIVFNKHGVHLIDVSVVNTAATRYDGAGLATTKRAKEKIANTNLSWTRGRWWKFTLLS